MRLEACHGGEIHPKVILKTIFTGHGHLIAGFLSVVEIEKNIGTPFGLLFLSVLDPVR